MIAALFQLHHRRAAVAFLPALLFGRLNEFFRCRVFGTVATRVGFVIADRTYAGAAAFAFAYLAAVLDCDVMRLDPLTAVFANAVDFVSCLVFEEFSIPVLLELLIEEFINMLEIDVVVCTATWGHVSGVCD